MEDQNTLNLSSSSSSASNQDHDQEDHSPLNLNESSQMTIDLIKHPQNSPFDSERPFKRPKTQSDQSFSSSINLNHKTSSPNHIDLTLDSINLPSQSNHLFKSSSVNNHPIHQLNQQPASGVVDLTHDSNQPSSSQSGTVAPLLSLQQKLKYSSKQQLLALNQSIARRQSEQANHHQNLSSNSNSTLTGSYPHLNIPLSSPASPISSTINPNHHYHHYPHQRFHPIPPYPGFVSNQSNHHYHYHPHSPLTSSPFSNRASNPPRSPSLPTSNQPSIESNINSNNSKPICIGLLSSLVLILYRLKDFEVDVKDLDGKIQPQTLPVRLCRFPPNGKNEMLKVLSLTGEQFGVVEHKIANVIGPLLGPIHSISGGGTVGGWIPNSTLSNKSETNNKIDSDSIKKKLKLQESDEDEDEDDDEITETDGLGGKKLTKSKTNVTKAQPDTRQLYIECCVIRRGEQNPMMLPLQLLLFCLPDFVPSVAAYLSRLGVCLEHPVSYHPEMHLGCLYDNPHSYQPLEAMDSIRQRLLGNSAYPTNAYNTRATVKACDTHQQVTAIFKNLASGVDLDETEPDEMIITPLYPHQKQALSFMLDRETSKEVPEDKRSAKNSVEKKALEKEDEQNLISLWKKTRDSYGCHIGWENVVTGLQQIGKQPPTQCRGAILADDMGLGKTISIISLIATTLKDAINYAKASLVKPTFVAATKKFAVVSGSSKFDPHSDNSEIGSVETLSKPSLLEELVAPTSSSGSKQKKEGNSITKKRIALEDRFKLIKVKSRATLIVCPLSTVQNWEGQIEEHVRRKDDETSSSCRSLSVCVYHGNSRTSDPKVLGDYDIVITTYSLLGYEFSRQNRSTKDDEEANDSSDGVEEVDGEGNPINSTPTVENNHGDKSTGKSQVAARRKRKGDGLPSPLQAIQWFRVVLDEAHMIKEHTTTQSKAACDLLAERRVCLTGTPLQNSLNDLFSLVCFLRLEPLTDRSLWTTFIGTPARVGEPLGVSRLQLIMRHIALRRTKETVDKNGKPILTLPAKKDEIIYLDLNDEEKSIYSRYHQRSRQTFMTLKKEDTVLKNYCSILQELLRLRQICTHPGLVLDAEAQSGKEFDSGRENGSTEFSKSKAIRLLILMRDTGATQCSECGREVIPTSATENIEEIEDFKPFQVTGSKRGRRPNGLGSRKKTKLHTSDETEVKDSQLVLVITACQHLFCLECFREHLCGSSQKFQQESVECSVCSQRLIVGKDIAEISPIELEKSIRMDELQGNGDVLTSKDCEPETKHSRKARIRKSRGKKGVESLPVQSDVNSIQLESEDHKLNSPPNSTTKEAIRETKATVELTEVHSNLINCITLSEPSLESSAEIKTDSQVESHTQTVSVNTTDDKGADLKDPTHDTLLKTPKLPASQRYSTKISHLVLDLLPFSQANPASMNYSPNDRMFNEDYDPNDPDADFKPSKGAVVKSVVFSQWTKLLDKIGNALDEFRIGYARLDGTMHRTERNKNIDKLKTDPKCEVLLVSLRAGGVGLNLTCAQRVYLMEPFWNPAVENQAVDRVHRLGQTKPVRMTRYIITGSVEQNMLEIQKRKTELANMSLVQTLSKLELSKRRVEDLHILFQGNINQNNRPDDDKQNHEHHQFLD
ncbi:hypothetical protein O181_025026 [Austropuccinia psidii MF-1]|uniref:Uncharacterized protein n=1 Tax=Austropuccinia psidii MF-1 TaxID=1389203 RepID=A0A9Q3CHS2_9BASI|nr:hypothetical protein [Austropuccinia psidii MF-1]